MKKNKPKSVPSQPRVPAYRRQLGPHGARAFVELTDPARGRPMRLYLGEYGTVESRAAYHNAIAEWEGNGRRIRNDTPVEQTDLTVGELCERFLDHAEKFYLKDGQPTSTIGNYKMAMRYLKPYHATDVLTFKPSTLKVVQKSMIDAGWSRKTINQHINLVRAIFRWGVAEELVPDAVHSALTKVDALKKGRSKAKEGEGISPVADSVVDATLPHLSPTVRAMVELERLTGMRPGEVCILRACDIDTDGKIWEFRPYKHKTEHHERDRIVAIGPQAQAILAPHLKRNTQAFIFSPAKSATEHLSRRRAARKTPDTCGHVPGSNRVHKPDRKPGEQFTTASYRRAIERACAQVWPVPEEIKDKPEAVRKWANDHKWAPNQLRHSFGTRVRKEFGLEEAQVTLGHASAAISEIYAERDQQKAREVARKIG